MISRVQEATNPFLHFPNRKYKRKANSNSSVQLSNAFLKSFKHWEMLAQVHTNSKPNNKNNPKDSITKPPKNNKDIPTFPKVNIQAQAATKYK